MRKAGFSLLLLPSITVFISSACIMIIELVASRLIARHLGSSLYTWTSVIGVVLAGITIGNYAGGRTADKVRPSKALGMLFGLASISCVVIIILNNVVGNWTFLWTLSFPIRVFGHVTVVFLLPSILLGTISPVVAKMALDKGLPTGRTVGDIYAWGAAGSIAGTFLAGFYLIATIGTVAILWSIAGILLLMGLFYFPRSWPLASWAAAFALLLYLGNGEPAWAQRAGSSLAVREESNPNIVYSKETPYCHVTVHRTSAQGQPEKLSFYQDKLKHSEIVASNVNALQYFYEQVFAVLTHRIAQNKSNILTLTIGGGGYVFPRYLEKNWPDSVVDVAEIDPGVTEAAHAAFGLDRNTRIRTFAMDARNYVQGLIEQQRMGQQITKYDIIYEDALTDFNVPFQLVTKEFNEMIFEILKDDGIYMVEMIDILEEGSFLGAFVNTISETFLHVYVITRDSPASVRTTFVVIASKTPFDIASIQADYGRVLNLRSLTPAELQALAAKSGDVRLIDDFAPVENMLASVVRQSGTEMLANRYFEMAQERQNAGELEKSNYYYELAAKNNMSLYIKSYDAIAINQINLNRNSDAVMSFRKAIDFYDSSEPKQHIIGSIHFKLGVLLFEMGQNQNGFKELELAVERLNDEIRINPNSHELYSKIGHACAMISRFEDAANAFAAAHRIEPLNNVYFSSLLRALNLCGRTEEAASCAKEQILLLKQQGYQDEALQIEQFLNQMPRN